MGEENYLQHYMNAAGLTQYRLAKISGISQAHISKLARGTAQAKPETLEKLAPALRISYEELMRAAGYIKDVTVTPDSPAMTTMNVIFSDHQIVPELARLVAKLSQDEQNLLVATLAAGSDVRRLLDKVAADPLFDAEDLRGFIRIISKAALSTPYVPTDRNPQDNSGVS